MPKSWKAQYEDRLLQPEDVDTVGWAGVPLKDTIAYGGMIKRPAIPTNDVLGFDPEYSSVDVQKILSEWIQLFNTAIERQDGKAVVNLMWAKEDCAWWKDVHFLTWDVRSIRGLAEIEAMLSTQLPKIGMKNVRLLAEPKPELEVMGEDLNYLTAHIAFDCNHGTGSGFLRLTPSNCKTGSKDELANVNSWRAHFVATALDTVKGEDAETGQSVRDKRVKQIDPSGKARTYHQMRADEVECREGFEPLAVIVGAGHSGLMQAARFKVLGIPFVIIEKGEAPGASWSNRYASLSLHNTTMTNHFPIIPFPKHFPDFIPAQQLGKFMEHYAEILDLNVWCRSEIDGAKTFYDEKTERWTVTVNRQDSTQRILHPKYLVISIGISGTLPNLPVVPGLAEFEKSGGAVVHSSRHRTIPDMKGKKAIVVGAATSAQDLCGELYDNGLEVTMIQRTSTHIISVSPGVRMAYSKYENIGEPGGMSLEAADRATFIGAPFAVNYEYAPRLFTAIAQADKETLDGLRKAGYRLNDGFHGTGALGLAPINLGGYYFNTGVSQYIIDGKVKIEHAEVDHLEANTVVLKDGKRLSADLVIYANGYFQTQSPIETVLGKKMAEKNDEWMEKGNGFIIDPEGEMRTYYRQLPQKGLFTVFQQFGYCRTYSKRLALMIYAKEQGIDTTPYGKIPKTPTVAESLKPRKSDWQALRKWDWEQ